MTAAESALSKYYALRTLARMIAWFENWGEVWRSYRGGRELPPLELRHSFVLRHRPEDFALMQVAEVISQRSYRRLVAEPADGTIIDIGANIGVTALDWATRLPAVRVHAYEPHPATFAVLAFNVQANRLTDRIDTFRQAVGGHRGTLRLTTCGVSVLSTAYSTAAPGTPGEEFEVMMISLDEAVARCPEGQPIQLVKIDTEGGEAEILEGATRSTLQRIAQVVLEYHNFAVPDALERCMRVLTKAGFECVPHPDRSHTGLGLLYCRRIGDARECSLAKCL